MTTQTPIKIRSGQHFQCREALNRFFAIGDAPTGGRHTHGGPIDPEPFAYVYGCAAVLSGDGDDPMAQYRELELRVGDLVDVEGYGIHQLERESDGYNLRLVPMCDGGHHERAEYGRRCPSCAVDEREDDELANAVLPCGCDSGSCYCDGETPPIGSSSAAAIEANRAEVEAARVPTFDVWIDGERTGDSIEAETLADAVRIIVQQYPARARGFSPLGRRDVTPAGGDWTSRALCSCEVEDDGDGESGPHLAIVEPSESCNLHGRVADPDGWAEMDEADRRDAGAFAEQESLAAAERLRSETYRLDRQRRSFDDVLRDALELSPEEQRELVARLFDSRAGARSPSSRP